MWKSLSIVLRAQKGKLLKRESNISNIKPLKLNQEIILQLKKIVHVHATLKS